MAGANNCQNERNSAITFCKIFIVTSLCCFTRNTTSCPCAPSLPPVVRGWTLLRVAFSELSEVLGTARMRVGRFLPCRVQRVLQIHAWFPCDFCNARFSRLAAVSALVKRFIAAMINTSSSVKPRVVIFHMTASQLVRSIATLCKARAVPNVVVHVSDGKARG